MSNIFFRFGTLYQNLRKAAVKKLESSNAKHVIFGVHRNERGQLSTFFKVFTDDRSFA